MKTVLDLDGKIVLLTGAGGYLGTQMAKGFARLGATVLLNGRDSKKLEELKVELVAKGGQAACLPFDVTDSNAVQLAMEKISQQHGLLDVIINNAYYGKSGSLLSASKGDFLTTYDVAVASVAELVRMALPLLRKGADVSQVGASVVNIASMYGRVSPDLRIYVNHESANPPYYGAAKAGLIQLTRYMACELGPDNIRVNAVAPGPFPSDEVQRNDPEFIQALSDKVPLKRTGRPSEIVGPVLFLASSAASFVTGTCIDVDGGWTAW